MILPRYPVYIPSKGRFDTSYTAKALAKDGVPFYIVVEPQEFESYAAKFDKSCLLVLPFSGRQLIGSRNWIKEHATKAGFERHWQLDDNIRKFFRAYRGRRLACDSAVALAATEDFVDRYSNIAIAGFNYSFFYRGATKRLPFYVNKHVYSCTLILNSIPHTWRSVYNDDTDICLQVIADGWCTLLMNAFLADKMKTMTVKGGNEAVLYKGDGRLKMARALERLWPGVVETGRRFKRPQHVIKYQWTRFDTPLKLKDGVDPSKLKPNEYGLELTQVKPIKNRTLRSVFAKSKASV